jgi:GMP synthase (glutamine-hydrolysing)
VRLLAIVHEDDAGPGVFGDAAHSRGWDVVPWRIADGERCPDAPGAFDAVLSLGGAMHAHETDAHPWLAAEERLLSSLVQAAKPVLGICLGAQLLARATGGGTGYLRSPEIGWYDIEVTRPGRDDPLLSPLADGFRALQWHSCDFTPGPGATILATSERCTQACTVGPRAWCVQFHAEVTGTDFEAWLDHHLAHPDEGDAPADAQGLRDLTRARMAEWNELGRALFGRFLDVAAVSPP